MRILLDTNVLIWTVAMPARLDLVTQAALESKANDVSFSAASIWEIAIKFGSNRSDFDVDPNAVLAEAVSAGFRELPIRSSTASAVAKLPFHHRDPFDRLIIAQAMAEPAHLYTSDAVLARYSELVTVIGRPS